jgi:sulfatase modifying factor 1
MGDDAGRPDERPAHDVVLRGFAVARTPVTNAEYERFLTATGHDAPRFWAATAFSHPAQPVVGVAWGDAAVYCDWLSAVLDRRYRLPSEAEWEFAARGGRAGLDYSWGDEPPVVAGVFLARLPQAATAAAGLSPPNGYGLCDMGFNVHEWCLDWYDSDYYAHSPRVDPCGPETGERRASRGGAWRHQVKVSRCAARSSLNPEFQYNDYGFRVVAE